MAKQIINLGTVDNDATGDTLKGGGDKINDNFNELYNVPGWGFYKDDLTIPTIVFGTTPVKLTINGAHSSSSSSFLPREIRGTSELWDTTNSFMTPINIGDSYMVRLDFSVTLETGNPTDIILTLDIGGQSTITNAIVDRHISAGKSIPYSISIGTPAFTLATFVANGGQIFLHTDSGSVTVGDRSIFIGRNSSGLI